MNNTKPVAWINKDLNYVELSTQSTVYGSHTIPLYTVHAVDSMEQELEQQLDAAREFCRQLQIENKQLKAQSNADNELNLQLNLKIMELQAENKKLGDYYMRINSMYWDDEIFEVKYGEGFYTDEFVKMIDDL